MTLPEKLRGKIVPALILILFWALMSFLYIVLPENRTVARRYGGMRENEVKLCGGDTVVQDYQFPFDGARDITVFLEGKKLGDQEIDVLIEDVQSNRTLVSETVNSVDLGIGQRFTYSMPMENSAGHVFRLTVTNRGQKGEDMEVRLLASGTVRSFESKVKVNGREENLTLVSRIGFCDAHVNWIYLGMWILFIAGSFLCLLLIGENHARNFLAIGLLCGLACVFWNPYPQPIDEPAHFFRAYALAEGHLNAELSADGSIGANISDNYGLYDCIWVSPLNTYANSELFSERSSAKREFFVQPYSANYISVNYLPAAAGVALGRALGLGVGWLVYLARLFNLAVYLAFGYFAIRTASVFRTAFFTAACLPLPLYFAGSVTIDTALNGAALYFCAICVKYIFSETETEKIGIPEMLKILLAAAFIASPKFLFYTPLFLLLFFIPKEKYARRQYQFILFGAGILLVAAMFLWQIYLMRTFVFEEDRNGNVSMAGQLAFIMEHPKTALRTLVGSFAEGIRNYFGTYTMYAPNAMKDITTVIALVICILSDGSVPEGRIRTRRIFVLAGLIIALLVAGLTVFAAYIGYTPVGAAEVEGVQPRYMLPVLPLIFIALACIPARYQGRNFASGSAFALLLVNAAAAGYTVLNFRAFP